MCRSSSALKDLNGGMCFGVAEGTVRCDFVVNASQVGVQVFTGLPIFDGPMFFFKSQRKNKNLAVGNLNHLICSK